MAVPIVAAGADQPLDVEAYVAIVLRAHPALAQSAGLEAAASAGRKAARRFPDPTFEYTRDRADLPGEAASSATETSYSVSQTIPWPGTFKAGIRAADQAGEAQLANADGVRWEISVQARQVFARLASARALLGIARSAEADARSLRDLVTRRADLGESRESDRIKAQVEWLRQQRNLAAAEREAAAALAILRRLAVEPLPAEIAIVAGPRPPLRRLDRQDLSARLERSPRLRAARAAAAQQAGLLSLAQKGRFPDLDLTLFRQNEIDKRASGFAVSVRDPLWNANRGTIALAQAATSVFAADASRLGVDMATDLEGRLKELEIASSQAVLVNGELLPAATRSVELARFSYEEGETSLLDLLDAQRTHRDTQREAVDAGLALWLSLTELQRLVGPDFDPWR